MSALYESCAGCGAANPSERCFGCFHDFGPGLTAPSNANTSGLEVVAWRSTWVGHTGKTCHAYHHDKHEAEDNAEHMSGASEPLVTAASAQARIAELEAENDVMKVEVIGLRAAIFGSQDYDPSLRHGNFIEMARATEDGRQGALARATAAEARADRLAKALEAVRAQADNAAFNINQQGVSLETADLVRSFETIEKTARAALQQEG